jgi:predicted transcriptional regulator
MAATTTTSIKLDDALKARLQKLGAARRRSVHWLMREAIAEYVAREEQGAQSARSDHQTVKGQTVDARARTEEAHAWLAELEAKGAARPLRPTKWRG